MRRRYVPLNWIQWLTLILCAAVAVVIAVGFHYLKHEQAQLRGQQAQLHYVQKHQNDALRSLLCRAERLVRRTPVSSQFTREDQQRALRFYKNALKSDHLAPCP